MKNVLENEFKKYEAFVYAYAKSQFQKNIKPWFEKKGYRFMAGNGTFWIGSTKNDKSIWLEDLPVKIKNILNMDIPGMPFISLGCFMPDFYPK